MLLVPLLAGCAPVRRGTGSVAPARAAKEQPVAAKPMPGEQIDYAGHRCGKPNFHVKTHPRLFPQRNVTR